MKKLKRRFSAWIDWKDLAWSYDPIQKLLILLGLKKDQWFNDFLKWRK